MRFRRILSVLLVAGCLFAFTSLAGSLDSSVSGDPDEIIDVDSELLPMDSNQVSDVSDSLNEADSSAASAPESSQTLLQKLLQLLEQLLIVLVGLLLLGALALLIHYRDRVWALIAQYLGRNGPGNGETTASNAPLSRPPENGIERAWLEMVRRASIDVDPSATPREYASAAVSDGLHQEPVRELTDLFERVRYGSGQITTKDVTQAERCLRESGGTSESGLDV